MDTELEMSGGEAASEDLRALLVTHNVCGVFDQMESALPFWVQELQALVREQSADFVALHMQETLTLTLTADRSSPECGPNPDPDPHPDPHPDH